ncbi:MAG: phosphotransferase [Candidatus Cloacimonetes bacterium]|nr:phosphotransferase [Candidatus Cloacimonadota bacterium]MDD4686874.1 phosphotransferase [Candidatus Cloacimonadota bacterium]
MSVDINLIIYPSVVTKTFSNKDLYKNELFVYKLNIPHVPKLLSYGQTEAMNSNLWYITTKRVKGKPYLDESFFNASQMGLAVAEFHKASLTSNKCLCHFDNQPKNILLTGSVYYFVDFTDSKIDFPETDITHLLLFWADEFDYKEFINLVTSFLNAYQRIISLDPNRWATCLNNSISRFDKRRQLFHKTTHSKHREINRCWLSEII